MGFRHSIHWRIQIWHGLLLLLLTSGFLVYLFQYERAARIQAIDAGITADTVWIFPLFVPVAGQETVPLARFVTAVPGSDDYDAPPARRFREFEADGNYVVAFDGTGRERYRSPRAPQAVQCPSQPGPFTGIAWRGSSREFTHVTPSGYAVIVGTPPEHLRRELAGFAAWLAFAGAVILTGGCLVMWWIVHTAMRPVEKISETAAKMAAGDLATRIPASGGATELQTLAAVLNDSFDRIDVHYTQQARFVAEVSHELSVPVSVVLAQTQLALERPREPEEYREALHACRRAAQRMQTLTRELLELAGYESGKAAREREACDLADLAREAAAAMEILIAEKNARVVERLDPAPARVNAESLSRALINLIGNALRHNAEGVTITLRSGRDGEAVFLEVADDGKGIEEEHLHRLFERFYRAGSDHSGNGLGLAITKAIVESHGGTISVESAPGSGTRFIIRLPVSRTSSN